MHSIIESMQYYEVAPAVIIRANQPTLTYTSSEPLPLGSIVEIPVGKRLVVGVITSKTTRPDYQVKPIERVLMETPLPEPLLRTLLWTADYYHTPLATVLQTALPRGITKKRRIFSNSPLLSTRERTNKVFTKDQSAALKVLEATKSGTILLHGVTGSGKTLIYIEQTKYAIANGTSVIILVPEIALTSQLVAGFHHHFKNIILTHSQQTEAERHLAWLSALNAATPHVIIGPRSALFLPVTNLGLVVIDECHEPSYKQEQSPRYSALRLASVLTQHHSAKLILGSATPSVSDYYLAASTNRPIVTLSKPARTDTVKPSVTVIDMTKRANFTRHRFLSDTLLAQFQATLTDGKQILVFHNRRGSATTSLCENCGWQAGCPRCFIPLTLHTDRHELVCHICAMTMRVPTHCPECGSVDIIHKGIGTKLIESELAKQFPAAHIARFDADTDSKQTLDRRYQELYDGTIDIIIGTQVIAKGLDLPHLRTVGVIQADAGLSLPDYSSPERTFQLLAQVIGRVGRSSHPTNVIVQSYQPHHPAVQDGITQNYDEFYKRTLAVLRTGNFPPFTYLLKLTCTYKTEATAIKNAATLAATLRTTVHDIDILGPTPAFYERVRDSYRWQIVVKSARRQALIDCLDLLPPQHWQFELDPLSLL